MIALQTPRLAARCGLADGGLGISTQRMNRKGGCVWSWQVMQIRREGDRPGGRAGRWGRSTFVLCMIQQIHTH
eukprot:2769670-Rhodomonas_salina.2